MTSKTSVPDPNDDKEEGNTSVGRDGRAHQPDVVVDILEYGNVEQIQQPVFESVTQQPGHDADSTTPLDDNYKSKGNVGPGSEVPSFQNVF